MAVLVRSLLENSHGLGKFPYNIPFAFLPDRPEDGNLSGKPIVGPGHAFSNKNCLVLKIEQEIY
jgi:hypothetical protein